MSNLTKEQILTHFDEIALAEADALLKTLRSNQAKRRPKILKQEKEKIIEQNEAIGIANKAIIKEGDFVYTTYKDVNVKAKVLKTNEATLTVQPLNEDGTIILTEKGKPAKPWKRYWQVSTTKPIIEEENTEEISTPIASEKIEDDYEDDYEEEIEDDDDFDDED
jgi:hypothetical protein